MQHVHAIFSDRHSAGRMLARVLARLTLADPVIVALPRGGVPVAFEVAKALAAPLDLLMVRKIGAPGHEEYGIGAVVDGGVQQIVIDHDAVGLTGADDLYLERMIDRQLAEIRRRRILYGLAHPLALEGREVVLVDDGIATGNTVRAALKALRQAGVARIVLAVPVAPAEALPELQTECDDLVCLATPEPFFSVGTHFEDFAQTGDDEVVHLLRQSRRLPSPAESGPAESGPAQSGPAEN